MRKLLTVLLLSGFFACKDSQDKTKTEINNISIVDRVLYPKSSLSPLFDSLRPATQNFIINGERDTLIVGKNGTTFSILKNSFVNAQGQPATNVTISLVELTTIADIISANLQTVSGDRILQTGGMFFIDAKEDGKSLAIAADKSIYVELRANYKDPQMMIFDGNFNSKKEIDWSISGNLENNLLTLPLSLLNFRRGGLECVLSDQQINKIIQPQYQNTFIATREFEERASILNIAACEQFKDLSQRLLDIYLSSIDKPLFIADSIAADYLLTNYRSKIDTTRKFEFDDAGWITNMYQTFLFYKNQRLTNAINFDKLGITEATTTEELVSKGYPQTEAQKYIACFKLRKQAIKVRETENQTLKLASYSFSISKLGWTNVDRFIYELNSDTSTFTVQLKCKDSLDYVSVSLVIPLYNVCVFSIHKEGNIYSFTKKEGDYRKLPVGQDAIVVAFSYKDNKPYFGHHKFTIPKDGQIELTLGQSTEQAIKQTISKLNE